jgi:hypothetical protein
LDRGLVREARFPIGKLPPPTDDFEFCVAKYSEIARKTRSRRFVGGGLRGERDASLRWRGASALSLAPIPRS